MDHESGPDRYDRATAIEVALARLVAQPDLADYVGGQGQDLSGGGAFTEAGKLAATYGLTHESIRLALAEADGDPKLAAARLAG